MSCIYKRQSPALDVRLEMLLGIAIDVGVCDARSGA